MFAAWARRLGRYGLVARVFARTVPPGLYGRVIKNAGLNALGVDATSSAVLGLTYRCQCRCVHCSAGAYTADRSQELRTSEWLKVLDSLDRMGVPRINLSGGEALLRPDLEEIIRYASRRFVVVLESNGQLLTRETVASLARAGVSCVAVSLDSHRAAVHDTLRSLDGAFDLAVQGLRNLAAQGVPSLLSTYVTTERANREEIDGLQALAREVGTTAIRILPPRPVGSFSCETEALLTEEDGRRVMDLADPWLAYFKGLPAPSDCGIFSRQTLYISPSGEVQPCPYLPQTFGNVRTSKLEQVLERMWNHEVFDLPYRDCLILNEDYRRAHLSDCEGKERDLPIEM